MAARFEKDKRRAKNPGTRLYAPTKDNAAFQEAAEETPETSENSAEETAASGGNAAGETAKEKRKIKLPTPIRARKEVTNLGRIGIMLCAFVFAGMVIFVLSGYERISRAYADINTLNDEIEQVNLHISELNVSIECAVTIQDAEEAALAAGMVYPTKAQSLRFGERIPVVNAGSPGSPSGVDPTVQTEGTPAEGGTNTADGEGSGSTPASTEDSTVPDGE